jgi:hypothetical protein
VGAGATLPLFEGGLRRAVIRALGGGWNERALPTEKQTLPFGPLDYRVVPADVE